MGNDRPGGHVRRSFEEGRWISHGTIIPDHKGFVEAKIK